MPTLEIVKKQLLVIRGDPGELKKLNLLIGCRMTACIGLPQKSCHNKIPVPQSLSWRPTTGQRA